ncbi:unnamed protein product [Meganyctiphanes norvegica]|uniref:RING-type domain-containing protein n=1 Tax=Meganyctiphanes norvegica TaxID=48144 RepID=A0AAV2QFD8_MEGNR
MAHYRRPIRWNQNQTKPMPLWVLLFSTYIMALLLLPLTYSCIQCIVGTWSPLILLSCAYLVLMKCSFGKILTDLCTNEHCEAVRHLAAAASSPSLNPETNVSGSGLQTISCSLELSNSNTEASRETYYPDTVPMSVELFAPSLPAQVHGCPVYTHYVTTANISLIHGLQSKNSTKLAGKPDTVDPEWLGTKRKEKALKELVPKELSTIELAPEDHCSICLETFVTRPTVSLTCKHVFHERCVRNWLKRQSNCPNCRKIANINDISIPMFITKF